MEKLYAGVGRSIITPEIGGHLAGYGWNVFSDSVNDDLTATVLVLRQGETTLVLISATVCVIDKTQTDYVRKVLQEKYGVTPTNVMLAGVHNHSGPYTYDCVGWGEMDKEYVSNIFLPGILAAADEAFANLQPAVLGVGETESKVGINRREFGPDGEVILGQNPWGQYDPIMTVIALRTEAGKPLVNVIHYGTHCTAAGANHEVTRDWCGLMIDRLEAESGAVTMFFNGTAGDVGPRLTNGKTTGDINYVREIGCVAALDAIRAYNSIKAFHPVQLKAVAGTAKLPYAPIPSREAAQAGYDHYSSLVQDNVNTKNTDYYKKILTAYEEGLPTDTHKELEQTVYQLGDIVLVPYGVEIFSEIGLRLRNYCSAQHTLCIGYANENLGYLPSQDQLCRGGYEVNMFQTGGVLNLADNTDSILIQQTLGLIEQL